MLVSALYFKGGWDKTFLDRTATCDEPFTRADGRVVQTPMMRQYGDFDYLETDHFQVVDLYYADPRFSLSLVLPRLGASSKDWTEVLSVTRSEGKGDVIIPRLDLSWRENLKPVMSRMGLSGALGSEPDYGAAASQPVKINEVVHKTLLVVDEQGALKRRP